MLYLNAELNSGTNGLPYEKGRYANMHALTISQNKLTAGDPPEGQVGD